MKTIASCGQYFAFARSLKELNLSISAKNLAERLKELCFRKFPILVLVGMCGTLFLRQDKREMEKYDTREFVEYIFSLGNVSEEQQNYFYFLRPGYQDFLLRLHAHPRIKLVFYSAMLEKNIMPILDKMLGPEMNEVRGNLKFFD